MKTVLKFALSAAAFAAALSVARAQSNPSAAKPPALPVISVQEVTTEDPTGYAMWVSKTNALVKQKLGVDVWIRSYLAVHAGKETGTVFNVQGSDTFANLLTAGTKLEKDGEILSNAQHYRGLRTLGERTLLKATRFEGRHTGGALFNTYANLPDEAGYMKSLDALRALFDQHGLKDCHINVYRVISGRSDYSHLVSINTPSMERVGAVLDSMSTPWMTDWFATASKQRTVVRNATLREITQ